MAPDSGLRPAQDDLDLPALLKARPLILFDGVCGLCSGFVHFVIERERNPDFRFIAVQSPLGQALLAHLGLPLTDWESNVVILEGRPHFKSEGFFRVLRRLRRPWPWLSLAELLPRSLCDWAYDRVARNRYALFGKSDHCLVPAPELRTRFLG